MQKQNARPPLSITRERRGTCMAVKRSNGEGGIYQRADGRWCGAVDLGVVRGRRRRKVVYGATRKAVSDKIRQLQLRKQQGDNLAPERITVAAFLQLWLD